MAWFKKEGSAPEDQDRRKVKVPEGLWLKCNHCRAIVYRKEVERSARVCPKCEYHFPISVEERIDLLLDLGSFREWSAGLEPMDPLHFKDTQRYSERLQTAQQSTGKKDAIVIGEGRINGAPVVLGVFHFGFMGGSMGSEWNTPRTTGAPLIRPSPITMATFLRSEEHTSEPQSRGH